MGIDYSPVLGVGVDSSEITYESLTDFAKKELLELFIDNGYMEGKFGDYYDDELIWSNVPQDDLEVELEEFFECHSADYDFIYDLGLTEYEGNLYSGWEGYRGVGINLNIETIKEDVEKAVQEVKKVVNLEPVLFTGVLVS